MKPLAITWVLLVGVVSAALSFLGFFAHMRTGGTPMIVTPGPGVVFAVATAILIWSGMAVRRLRAGKDTWIDAIGAMRVAVFARTSALVGAGLVGVLIGVMGVSLTQLEAAPMVSNAIASGVARSLASSGSSWHSSSNAGAPSIPTTTHPAPISATPPRDLHARGGL